MPAPVLMYLMPNKLTRMTAETLRHVHFQRGAAIFCKMRLLIYFCSRREACCVNIFERVTLGPSLRGCLSVNDLPLCASHILLFEIQASLLPVLSSHSFRRSFLSTPACIGKLHQSHSFKKNIVLIWAISGTSKSTLCKSITLFMNETEQE